MLFYGLSVMLLLAVPTHIVAYKSGAPDTVCDSMIPEHHTPPQTSPSPYTLTLSKTSIKAGESLQLTISGNNNKKIKGFFVQARVGNTPIGQFSKAADVQLVNCGKGIATGATHVDNTDKNKVTVTWTAPGGTTETVKFRVTTVEDGGTFWVGQQSAPVTIN